jgi:GH35 family endo-1,4-beta-xylanase
LRRYPDVKEWVFLNEPLLREPRLDDNGVNQDEVVFDPEEDFDFFVELFKRAKEIAPDVKLYVNEYSILTGNQTGNYIKFIQKLLKAGAPIDGVGVQGHIFNGWDFASIPQMKENLDDLAKLGLPIKITEFDVSDEDMKRMYFPPGAEGITEQQLQEARADYTRKAMTIFYGNPKVNGICLWGFQDKTHWRGERETASPGVQEHAGLFDENFQPNQVGRAFQNLTQEQWKINIGGKNI